MSDVKEEYNWYAEAAKLARELTQAHQVIVEKSLQLGKVEEERDEAKYAHEAALKELATCRQLMSEGGASLEALRYREWWREESANVGVLVDSLKSVKEQLERLPCGHHRYDLYEGTYTVEGGECVVCGEIYTKTQGLEKDLKLARREVHDLNNRLCLAELERDEYKQRCENLLDELERHKDCRDDD